MSPRLTVAPDRVLVDEVLDIEAEGFDSGQAVTVEMHARGSGTAWAATATFEADDDGVVDPGRQAPVSGDYDGVRPMGLFQFARPADPGDLSPGETRLRALVEGEVVATATCERRSRARGVSRVRVDDAGTDRRVVGDLLVPPGEGPHPGVLLLGGSAGGRPLNGHLGSTAELLASRGYAVLALAYFGIEGLPEALVEVPLEYFDAAVDYLSNRDLVQSEPLGVLGHSRGGEAALLVGARNDAVRTGVAYAPSSHAFQGIPRRFAVEATSAWTDEGDPVPFVPVSWRLRDSLSLVWNRLLGRPVAFADAYAEGIESASESRREAAAIPVEDVDGPVLVISGEDDRVWPGDEFGRRIDERLEASGYEHPHDHVSYERAGHGLGVPYRPVRGRSVGSTPRVDLALGGTPEGYANADADAWPRVLEYLELGLRREAGPRWMR